jgi:hypothetical protein
MNEQLLLLSMAVILTAMLGGLIWLYRQSEGEARLKVSRQDLIAAFTQWEQDKRRGALAYEFAPELTYSEVAELRAKYFWEAFNHRQMTKGKL